MKKIVAMMLALLMVLVSVSALAAETGFIATTGTETTVSIPVTAIQKEYTVKGGTSTLFPKETLSFTATQLTDTNDPGTVSITIDDIVVDKQAGSYTMTIKYAEGAFTKPGLYHYSIAEDGTAQGVTYDTNPLKISIYVAPDLVDGVPADTQLKVQHIGITKVGTGDDATKDDKIENTYNLGNLEVTKEVKGNMADVTQPFTITVDFSATKTVFTDIKVTVEDGATIVSGATANADGTYTIAAGNGWTGSKAKTVTMTIKNTKKVTFTDIPDGVTYAVKESSEHGDETGNPFETDPAKGYKIGYTDDTGSIEGESTKTCTVTNTKSLEPDTGIALDTVPYMMIMAIALMGVAMMISRRRREEM